MKRIALLAVAASMALAAPTHATVHPAKPVAHASCTHARIIGKRKCITRGQFCVRSRRANRDYHRYGLHCGKRDANGNYHLVYY